MDTTPEYDYSPETMLRRVAAQNAELRELLVAVAGDLECIASEHPEIVGRLLARSMRLRRRLHEAKR